MFSTMSIDQADVITSNDFPKKPTRVKIASATTDSATPLGPDILDSLEKLGRGGRREILVIPIGFVSDHLEILYDIDVEARTKSSDLSVHLERADSFNDSGEFIDVLKSVIIESGFLETKRSG